jgi:helix-turn-helix protein
MRAFVPRVLRGKVAGPVGAEAGAPDRAPATDPSLLEIGERLKRARTAMTLTLEDLSAGTSMPLHFLKGIERADYREFPSIWHASRTVRAYALMVGEKAGKLDRMLRRGMRRIKFKPKYFLADQQWSTAGEPHLEPYDFRKGRG